jgi:preprotein translocase subunit SecF
MKLNIIQQRGLWWAISGAFVLAGLVAMAISWQQFGAPLKPGLDFAGGTRLQLTRACTISATCADDLDLAEVRQVLGQQGLDSSSLQTLGDDQQVLSIRTRTLSVDERTALQTALDEAIGPFDPNSTQIDTVGPVVGKQLLVGGLLALLVSFAGIVIYISLRFKLDYALLAILALVHDVIITAGLFAVLGLVLGVEVDSLFIVSLLTIVGFSVNDTVVIYDRVRENMQINPGMHINDVVDSAVNQTLARSINTTLTVLLPLGAIVIFGGQTLKYFALALIVGFVSGAYSSIFVASSLLALWRERAGQAYASDPDLNEADPQPETLG